MVCNLSCRLKSLDFNYSLITATDDNSDLIVQFETSYEGFLIPFNEQVWRCVCVSVRVRACVHVCVIAKGGNKDSFHWIYMVL